MRRLISSLPALIVLALVAGPGLALPPTRSVTPAASSMPSGIAATKIADGSVSNAEYQRLDGVSSALQGQIDGKAATSHTHAAADVASGTLAKARGGTAEDNSTGGTANTFWARPDGAAGASAYRLIVSADLPTAGPGAATYCGGGQYVTSVILDAYGRVTTVNCATPATGSTPKGFTYSFAATVIGSAAPYAPLEASGTSQSNPWTTTGNSAPRSMLKDGESITQRVDLASTCGSTLKFQVKCTTTPNGTITSGGVTELGTIASGVLTGEFTYTNSSGSPQWCVFWLQATTGSCGGTGAMTLR